LIVLVQIIFDKGCSFTKNSNNLPQTNQTNSTNQTHSTDQTHSTNHKYTANQSTLLPFKTQPLSFNLLSNQKSTPKSKFVRNESGYLSNINETDRHTNRQNRSDTNTIEMLPPIIHQEDHENEYHGTIV
jgi:hypothetical protein